MREAIPDFDSLVAAVLHRSTFSDSFLHGVGHWRAVAWTGLQLLPDVSGSDRTVVLLFALFHDSMRVDDGYDPDHGRRGGLLARELHGQLFRLSPRRLDKLQDACDRHTDGRVTADPTIGACWDADRLNLWRVGARPERRLLSTEPARKPERIQWAERLHGQPIEWGMIWDEYCKLT